MPTHSIRQRVLIRVVWRRALLYLFQQQGVFDQTASREIQEVPQVQLPAERRLLAQAQEVLHSLLVLLLVQQGFGPHLVTAVCNIGPQARELQRGRAGVGGGGAMRQEIQSQIKERETEMYTDWALWLENTGTGESEDGLCPRLFSSLRGLHGDTHPVQQSRSHLSDCFLWSPQPLQTTQKIWRDTETESYRLVITESRCDRCSKTDWHRKHHI